MDEFTFASTDGVEVFARRWVPSGQPRAAIVVVHGAAEHSGRYTRVAEVLRGEGYAVYALDLRGHGRSAGSTERGRIGPGGMAGVLSDVGALVRRARSEAGDVPVILFGHSMGSVVVQAFMVGAPEDVSAYVLSGTMGPAEGTEEFVAGMRAAVEAGMADEPLDALAGYNASDEPTRTRYDWLSRDEDEVDKYIADPLCGDDNPLTYGYVAVLLETIADVMEPDAIARIPKGMPVLLLTGDRDPVSENGAQVRQLERRLRDAGLDVTARYYVGARHEVLNETNRDEVHRDLVEWLDRVSARGALT
ncbi:MAG TPA: alpha/beta hydrolase [Acidimicrobiia bacterium]|nr:alpha/beta hydrolase [Acidimicrobiia bacterium]